MMQAGRRDVQADQSSAIPVRRHAVARLITMLIVGVVVALTTGPALGWAVAPALSWVAAALVFVLWTWLRIRPLDAKATRAHASVEDPSRRATEIIVLTAVLASLGATGLVIYASHTNDDADKVALAALAALTVTASWFVLHTLYGLRYAAAYYQAGEDRRGARLIDFNMDDDPPYTDFFYFSFNLGMTFQVSDTSTNGPRIRALVLAHCLLSYLFSTVILATTVNLVVGLFG